MATFHAPPWWPAPPVTFFRLMMTGAAFVGAAIFITFPLTRSQE